jgi:hypothetical protein
MKKIICKFLQLQAQMKMLHWQTTSRAEHIAFGDFYEEADGIIDRIVENIQGKYGRIQLGGLDSLIVSDYSSLKVNVFLMDFCTFIDKDIFNCGINKDQDREIDAIIDELRSEVNKLKYLLTLK